MIGRTCLSATALVGTLFASSAVQAASSDEETCGVTYVAVAGLVADEVSAEGVVPIARWAFSVESPRLGMVEVLDPAGSPVEGALEVVASRVVVWRPDEPLEAGLEYAVTASTENAGQTFADSETEVLEWSFVASEAPPSTAAPEEIITGVDYVVTEQLGGGALVCCDGAFPVLSGHGDELCFEGICGSTFAVGELELSVAFAETTLPAVAANTFARRIGVPTEDGDEVCYPFSVTDLTTGAETELERCHARPPGQTGILSDHDPVPALLEVCEGEPYTCGIHDESDQGWAWNRDDCVPISEAEDPAIDPDGPPSEDDEENESGADDAEEDADDAAEGCSCRATGDGRPVSLVALPFLVGLASRRRRRR